ncbi:hypothetical protein P9112_006890 [Eukaryota sp. TZLM1-RC]
MHPLITLSKSTAKVPTAFCCCGPDILAISNKSGIIQLAKSNEIISSISISIISGSRPPSITSMVAPPTDLPNFGTVFAVSCVDGSIRIIELSKDSSEMTEARSISPITDSFAHKGIVSHLVWDIADRIISCGHDQTIKLWDPRTCAHMDTHYGHQGPVHSLDILSYRKDTNQLSESIVPVSCGIDRTCRVWKLAEESHLCFRAPSSTISLECVAAIGRLSGARVWVSGDQKGGLSLWADNKKRPVFVTSITKDWVNCICYDEKTQLVLAGTWNQVYCFKVEDHPLKLVQVGSVDVQGCVNQILIDSDKVKVLIGREHKSGRWKVFSGKDSFNGVLTIDFDEFE